jgi:large subunit ribosomal protein L2
MPKRMKVQRRGKGKPRYISPSNRYKVAVSYPLIKEKTEGEILDIINDPVRTAPVMIVQYGSSMAAIPAAEGMRVGDLVYFDSKTPKQGDIMKLKDIPEGTSICNLEIVPGDGGKMVRSSGLSAKVVSREQKFVMIKLPSKKQKRFNPECRATIGRKEKPLMKAGKNHHILKNKTRVWPVVAGGAMNPVDHPFGGGKRRHKKRKTISRRKPSGGRVGSIAARRTGRKRGSR